MRNNSSGFFLFPLILLGIVFCTISACSEDEVPEVFEQKVVLEMTQRSWPANNFDRMFLSNKSGELVDCRYNFWQSPTEFVNEIPLNDDYLDLTFSAFPNIELNKYRLFTYTNIKRKSWEIHQIKESLPASSSQFDIEFF